MILRQIPIVALLAIAMEAAADNRCQWADCTITPAPKDAWTIGSDSSGAPLPVCKPSDKAACAETCRKEFDSRYRHCVNSCMQQRCVVPTPEPTPGPDGEIGAPCVEIESPICEEQCAGESSSLRPRCRRDCLQRACPDTNALDIAKESLDPGTFRCDRCRKRYEVSCARQCALGMIGTFAGLERWGCEKACLITYCSKSCGTNLGLIP